MLNELTIEEQIKIIKSKRYLLHYLSNVKFNPSIEEEEIKIKELKGPVLFKQDSRVLENVMVWRRIKIIILSICMISGILFYGTLPIIVSFSSNK